MRTYIVARSDKDGANLQLVELCEANGATQAIKRTRDARDTEPNTRAEWHAIPVRNWTTIAVETVVVEPRTTYTEIPAPKLPTRAADPSEEQAAEAAPELDPPEAGEDPLVGVGITEAEQRGEAPRAAA